MEEKFYRRHNADFFAGKKGKMIRQVQNAAGHVIEAGEIVSLRKAHKGLELTSSRRKEDGCCICVRVKNVSCVELLDE